METLSRDQYHANRIHPTAAPSADTEPLVRCMSMGNVLYPGNHDENANRGPDGEGGVGVGMGSRHNYQGHSNILPGYVTYKKLSTFNGQEATHQQPRFLF